MNLKRGCDTLLASIPPPAKASKSLWLGNGVWKNGAQTACTAGATGCCSVAEIDELLNPPPSDGNQPDALCPAKAGELDPPHPLPAPPTHVLCAFAMPGAAICAVGMGCGQALTSLRGRRSHLWLAFGAPQIT